MVYVFQLVFVFGHLGKNLKEVSPAEFEICKYTEREAEEGMTICFIHDSFKIKCIMPTPMLRSQ